MPRFSERLHAVFIIFANQREHIFLLYTILSCNFLRSNHPLKKVHAFGEGILIFA